MRKLLFIIVLFFSTSVLAQIEEMYVCTSTQWVEVKIDDSTRFQNTIFGVYIEDETLKFKDEGGYFENKTLPIITKQEDEHNSYFISYVFAESFKFQNGVFTYANNLNLHEQKDKDGNIMEHGG